MNKTLLILVLMITTVAANAQDASLAAGQNPRYRESMDKYMASKDDLQKTNNTTVQETYKAYDWYQAKMERRQDRINYRRQLNLYRYGYNNPYGNYYSNDYYNDNYYNDSYRYNYRSNNYRQNCHRPYNNWYYWIW